MCNLKDVTTRENTMDFFFFFNLWWIVINAWVGLQLVVCLCVLKARKKIIMIKIMP